MGSRSQTEMQAQQTSAGRKLEQTLPIKVPRQVGMLCPLLLRHWVQVALGDMALARAALCSIGRP